MKHQNKILVALSCLLALAANSLGTLPANACAFAIDSIYSYSTHPDFPLKRYAAGALGIVQPEFARSYLIVAYRYLSGSPLSPLEQEAMVALWDSRLLNTSQEPGSAETKNWLAARKVVQGAARLDDISTTCSISQEESWETYANCQTAAFETAVATLKELVAKFGANSEPVKQWLLAQDLVFSNCGDGTYGSPRVAKIPPALPASADPLMRADRAYQIACALFYAQNFDLARRDFEAIANDHNSPWQQMAGYLAVRAMIRGATLAKTINPALLAQAQKRLKSLGEDSSYAKMKDDLQALNNYIAARLEPAEHLRIFAGEKLTKYNADELTKTLDMIVGDKFDDRSAGCKYADLPASVKAQDLTDWIMTVQSTDSAGKKHAQERWKQTHSAAWLVAALMLADGEDASLPALLAAAGKEQSGPGKLTVLYQVNRLNLKRQKDDIARTALDKILAAPISDLPLSSLNMFRTQRLLLAGNLDEFARLSVQNPACLCYDGGVQGVPDDVEALESGKSLATPPLHTPEAACVIDTKLPLSLRIRLAGSSSLPAQLRYRLLWTSWVRAILVGDDPAACTLARLMKPLNKSKAKLVDAYLGAASVEDRKFAATFLMLQYSSAVPNCGFGPIDPDGYGDASGWWWAGAPVAKFDGAAMLVPAESLEPSFLSDAQSAVAKKELAALAKVSPAPNYFALNVLAWAKSHPDDNRLPQALHFAVNATHYGATDQSTTRLSKQCFQLLHSRFKNDPWTKKTPYFY